MSKEREGEEQVRVREAAMFNNNDLYLFLRIVFVQETVTCANVNVQSHTIQLCQRRYQTSKQCLSNHNT